VVGRGNPFPFRRIAQQIGLGEQLFFVEETDNIFHYYGVGDIVVLPTLYDPFSNVCLEALACGIPVITTKENGASEIIRPGETGIVISGPHNRAELAAGISRFLPHEVRDSVKGKAPRSVQNFTIEENTRRTLEVYQNVLLMKGKINKSFSV
jgi:UDP-glucose:(heptosyl)LPS alpha-1,3-glucosyltransferase